ncbi:MAG: DUF6531 domain-containing protein, partial [Nitrospinota bacterium]|nr:DUF6531 domain-containing protein [Nitrospinota bacterium]
MTVDGTITEQTNHQYSEILLKPKQKNGLQLTAFIVVLFASFIVALPSASANYPNIGSVTLTEIGQSGAFDVSSSGCGWTGTAVSTNSGVATVSPTAISATGNQTFSVTAVEGGDTAITVTYAQDGNPVTDELGYTIPCDLSGSITIFIYVDLPLTPVGGSGSDFPDAGTDGDPVNTHTGELFFTEPPDINLGGPLPLRFQRYYASKLRVAGIGGSLGNNWRHNFEWSIHWTGNLLSLVNDKG